MIAFVKLSIHAKEQARERGITITEIKMCIVRGAKHKQNGKIIAEFGYIRVAYKMLGEIPYIITVMIR